MKKTLLLALTLIAVGCGPMDVTLTHTVTSLEFDEDTNRWECRFTLNAEGSVFSFGQEARWVDGEINYRDRAGGTVELNDVELLDHFGTDRLRRGESLSAPRMFTLADTVGTLQYTLRLQLSDSSRISRTTFVNC